MYTRTLTTSKYPIFYWCDPLPMFVSMPLLCIIVEWIFRFRFGSAVVRYVRFVICFSFAFCHYNNGSDDTSGVINMANAQFMSVYILALISRKHWFSFQSKRLEILWWKFANHGSVLELLISNLGRILWKYWNSQGKYDGNIHFCVSNSRLLNVYTRHCFDW